MAGDQAMKRNQVLETLASTPRLRPVLSRASQLSQPISHFSFPHMPVLCCSTAQLCLTLCDPMDCSPPGSSVHEDSPGKSTGVGCHALLQGIFPTQGSNPGLLRILYHLSHQGRPRILDWISYPFSRGSPQPRD